ncbi:hypothetical protein [Streptomyces sp. NPDC005078]|uniref:hypothetical protein n=1 Tax=unclassified Streptomyces TaxID=2593676 RepID=UPI0033A908DF
MHVRSRSQPQGEITYIVHPRVWGPGIGTEIGRQLLSYGLASWGFTGSMRPVTRGISAPPGCWPRSV